MPDTQAVFLDLASVSQNDIDLAPLEQAVPGWSYFSTTQPEETAQRIEQAELVVSNKVILDRETLQRSGRLKLICIAATGTNNVDLEAARELGIRVSNVAGYSTPSVVQQVFAMILGLTTRQTEYTQAIQQGSWQQSDQFCLLDYPFHELDGKRMGIVGYGGLGRAVARVAEAFGMEVMLCQRPGGPAQLGRIPLDQLLPQVDILSLHCPLTPETQGLISGQELAAMKSSALLINSARGGVVDETALANALRTGQLGGAGVDVLTTEPPTEGNPLLEPGIPNLILTPHIAWASIESRQRLVDEIARNIQAFHAGEERNVVI
ncbi:MAG: 2-hydroxyacid dehydrogenase [Gammaproteobacteria bacterium]|nr:2-hydroxyacid dehydrogenase [Gammaproteobacteria bacterium]